MNRPSWHIAIIDDNADDRANIRQLLLRHAERGYTFSEAETGSAGLLMLQNAEARTPTCVILDFSLPDMEAPSFLTAMQAANMLTTYPIVVLTGGADRATGREVLRAGAQDFLGKSWLISDSLTRAVENAVERHELAREFRHQSAMLQLREQELRNNDRKKDEFLATLAHELRNPLAPISNGLAILRETDNAATLPIRLIMERQLEHLVRLVDDLLDISRISSGKVGLRMERVAVSTIIGHALETTRSLVDAAHHRLAVIQSDSTLAVHGDLIRLGQVIGNLLNNSIKYTPPGGRIRIEVLSENAFVVIRITDNGVGIDQTMLPNVFDLFTQIDGTVDQSQGGLGIGLTLVKRFLELHNGSVTAESAGLGSGSMFTVRLPLSHEVDLSNQADPLAPGEPEAPRRILVVDDSVDVTNSLATMLRLRGHETRTANSGEEALAVAAEFLPEVAFLDIGLPGMSGYELAHRLRENSAASAIFLVAVSGWGSDGDKRKAREAGFDMHLTKPADAQRIFSILHSLGTPASSMPAILDAT